MSYLFKFQFKYYKELRCLNTKGIYSKVRGTEIKLSIISKSVTIIIFVEFIDQLSIIRLIVPALLFTVNAIDEVMYRKKTQTAKIPNKPTHPTKDLQNIQPTEFVK